MSPMRVLAVLLLAVVVISCSGQPADQSDTNAQSAGEEVFEDDFESGETDEWKNEGKAAGEAEAAPSDDTTSEPEAEPTDEH